MPVPSAEHARRTLTALREALETVPFYARQGRPAPSDDDPLEDALAGLPLLTRARIRPTLPKAWVPASFDLRGELAAGRVTLVETGLGEGRVRILWDPTRARLEERAALAVNPTLGAALADEASRDAVLWMPERGMGSCGAGDPSYEDRLEGARLHLNPRQDPTFWTDLVMNRMLDELAAHRPRVLQANPFYLDVLARHAAQAGRALEVGDAIVLTHARATAAQLAAIRAVCTCPVFDVYAGRALGVLFVEGVDGRLHHVPAGSHVELVPVSAPTPGARNLAHVVVTSLGRAVQPLVRFVTGDLVEVADGGGSPVSGVPSIVRVEGQLEDAVVRPDGAIVTPAAVDRCLASLQLAGYQLTQTTSAAVELDVLGGDPPAAATALAPLLAGLEVHGRSATALAIESNGKYKSVRRRSSLPPALKEWE